MLGLLALCAVVAIVVVLVVLRGWSNAGVGAASPGAGPYSHNTDGYAVP